MVIMQSYTLRTALSDIWDDFFWRSHGFGITMLLTLCFQTDFKVMLYYRLMRYFWHSRWPGRFLITMALRKKMLRISGCDISPQAILGRRINLPHPTGIVIGSGVIVHDKVRILQQVTIGINEGEDSERLYPTVESQVSIFTGACVIGGINIGQHAIIGANAVVLCDVPMHAVAVGVPARVKLAKT